VLGIVEVRTLKYLFKSLRAHVVSYLSLFDYVTGLPDFLLITSLYYLSFYVLCLSYYLENCEKEKLLK
jgi:hypothetical protein